MGHIGINLGPELGAVASVPAVGKAVMDTALRSPFLFQCCRLISETFADVLFVFGAVGVDWARGWIPEDRGLPVTTKNRFP